jgi:hypothetical protein
VEYGQGRRPRVTVVDPPLQRHDGQQLPHVFPSDDLCLYYDEFDGGQHLIADTVVPWISEWLFHYELWLSTGSWHGGGVHPGQGSTRRGRRRAEAERTPRPDLPSATG